MGGHSVLFEDALRSLDKHLNWRLQFLLVCDHARPIPVFKPSVLLCEELEPEIIHQVWPVPILKRGRPAGGRGRGRGGARARGRGRRGGRAGRGGAGPAELEGDAPLAIEDGSANENYDEAADESDLGNDGAESEQDIEMEQGASDEESY